MTRYKSASESAEKVEDELKVEKRKLQREVGYYNVRFTKTAKESQNPQVVGSYLVCQPHMFWYQVYTRYTLLLSGCFSRLKL